MEKEKLQAVIDTLNQNSKYKYYVYALCERTQDGSLIPFYIGKGEGARVWAHEEGEAQEIELIKKNIDNKEEQDEAISLLSKKYRKIHELRSAGCAIEKIIIKWGMTSDEAFMAESALINLLSMTGLKVDIPTDAEKLTNIVNGHASVGEKENACKTEARTVEVFYSNCAQEPLIFNDMCETENIVLISINKAYKECENLEPHEMNEAIKQVSRGFWRVSVNSVPDYLFAMYQQKIVGVYRVKKTYREVQLKRKVKKISHLYSILDVYRDDYPKSTHSETRTKDLEYATKIYEACEKDSEGNIVNIIKYSEMSKELQEIIHKMFGELDSDEKYEQAYNNWLDRKYYVLEDIQETDADAHYLEYIGRRIVEYKDGEAVSPIPPRNFIRYMRKKR